MTNKTVMSYLPKILDDGIEFDDPRKESLEYETEEKFHNRFKEIFYSSNRHERRRKASMNRKRAMDRKARKKHKERGGIQK